MNSLEKNYIVRPYKQGDEEEIVQLLDMVFEGWPHFDLSCGPLDHWNWKFEDNPMNILFTCIAVNDNKIIGCNHTIPKRVKIGDNIILSGIGVDVAVHPDFRRRRINTRTRDCKFNIEIKMGLKFQFDIEFNPIFIERALRHGLPRFPHDVLIFVRIHDVDLHLKMFPTGYSWLKKYGFLLVKLYNKFRCAFRISPPAGQNFSISKICRFDERINAFWINVKDHYSFIVERSQDYLNWRYCDKRGGEYIVKQIVEEERVLGYSVLRINSYRNEYPIGYIVDLLALPERLDVINALIEDAVIYFDNNDINIIQCLGVKNHTHESILSKYGFVNSWRRLDIFYQLYENITENLKKVEETSEKKIYFVYGDYDAI